MPINANKDDRIFRDGKMQFAYEHCRKKGRDRASDFWWNGFPAVDTAQKLAYWNGRLGKPSDHPPGRLHAAWKAGADDLRDIGGPA
jgi:hypothetical protein